MAERRKNVELTVLRLFGPGASPIESRLRRVAIPVRGPVSGWLSAACSSDPSSSCRSVSRLRRSGLDPGQNKLSSSSSSSSS